MELRWDPQLGYLPRGKPLETIASWRHRRLLYLPLSLATIKKGTAIGAKMQREWGECLEQ
jgi:hypothetical protein